MIIHILWKLRKSATLLAVFRFLRNSVPKNKENTRNWYNMLIQTQNNIALAGPTWSKHGPGMVPKSRHSIDILLKTILNQYLKF